jgi:hypothetical protein
MKPFVSKLTETIEIAASTQEQMRTVGEKISGIRTQRTIKSKTENDSESMAFIYGEERRRNRIPIIKCETCTTSSRENGIYADILSTFCCCITSSSEVVHDDE